MIRTFGKVIGISVGIVAVVFLVVAMTLYRSGPDAMPQEGPQALSTADSSLALRSQPAPETPEVVKKLSTTTKKPSVRKRQPAPPARTSSSAHTVVRAEPEARSVAGTSSKNAKSMTPDEYVEREMYYVNKIGEESEQVLQRSAEARVKLESYKAELDALLHPDNKR